MKKLLIAATVIALISTPLAMAKGHGKAGKHGHMKILRQLDLSSEQKEQVKVIMQQAKSKAKPPSEADRNTMFEQHMALLSSATFDKNAATDFIEQQHQHKKQRKLTMLETQHQIYQLLDAEQQIKYQSLTKEKMDKMAQKKAERAKNKQ